MNSLPLNNIPKLWVTTSGPESGESVAHFYCQLILYKLLTNWTFIFCWDQFGHVKKRIFQLCCLLFGPTGDSNMFMVHILFSSSYSMYTCEHTVKDILTGSCPVQPQPSTVGWSAVPLPQLWSECHTGGQLDGQGSPHLINWTKCIYIKEQQQPTLCCTCVCVKRHCWPQATVPPEPSVPTHRARSHSAKPSP